MAAAAHLTTLQQHLSSLVRVGGSAPAALARVCSSADLGFDPGVCTVQHTVQHSVKHTVQHRGVQQHHHSLLYSIASSPPAFSLP